MDFSNATAVKRHVDKLPDFKSKQITLHCNHSVQMCVLQQARHEYSDLFEAPIESVRPLHDDRRKIVRKGNGKVQR